jgi:UDP-N-acetylglucosamine diphosphorylase / glucose-1-phosphate thymidylyltransferase / UDP-N-acetylgalactosamine diphosphorylase / glucosamine-1-phosphate N-acetyltransferase / galactosamine-1-phosphate N-acetyltransferase
MQACIFEDIHYRNFLPLAYLRPVYELRCGSFTLRENIESYMPRASVSLHVRGDLAPFWGDHHKGRSVSPPAGRDTWFINGRLIADENLARLLRKKKPAPSVYLSDGEVAAAFVRAADVGSVVQSWERPFGPENFRGMPVEPFECAMARYPWDLVSRTPRGIELDFERRSSLPLKSRAVRVGRGIHLINRKNIMLGTGSVLKPGVVLDAERGPVILGRNVTVLSNAVIEGPAFVGDDSLIKVGAKIYHGTSIGEHCKVGGEVEASVVQSFSNKQHDGFLGHSYLGSWINIGADTNTSDLKNTYGHVKVRLGDREIDTGLQFVGLTMGDHSTTGINVMFDTGSVVGVSCNLFGAGLPPKFVPSFSWGEKSGLTVYDPGKAVDIARRMMARRDVQMSTAYEMRLRNLFSMTEEERGKAGIS